MSQEPRQWAPRVLAATEFRARFTVQEEAAVLVAARTDPVVQVLYSRLLDPRQMSVYLDDPQIVLGLGYLASLDDPTSLATPRGKILTVERVAEILA